MQKTQKRTKGVRAAKLSVEERRDQLLRAAIRAFASKGIASAGHKEVASEAGVAVPTVFSYFPTRAALVEAVVNEVERIINGRAYLAAEPHLTVHDKLLAVLDDFAEFVGNDPDYAIIWVNWGSSFYEHSWSLYERFIDRVIKLHEHIIAEGRRAGEDLKNVDPKMSAYLFIGAATVIVQMRMQNRDSKNLHKYLETALHGALYQMEDTSARAPRAPARAKLKRAPR